MTQLNLNDIPLHVRVDNSLEPGHYLLIGASPKLNTVQVISSKMPDKMVEFEVTCDEIREGEPPDSLVLGIQIEISNPETGEKTCQQIIF